MAAGVQETANQVTLLQKAPAPSTPQISSRKKINSEQQSRLHEAAIVPTGDRLCQTDLCVDTWCRTAEWSFDLTIGILAVAMVFCQSSWFGGSPANQWIVPCEPDRYQSR